MKSVRLQLLVTFLAAAVAVGFFIYRGPPPSEEMHDVPWMDDGAAQARRNLRWGVSPNVCCGGGWGDILGLGGGHPLDYAIRAERNDIIELLLAYSADINARNTIGQTPLTQALELESPKAAEVVELLRKHGATE